MSETVFNIANKMLKEADDYEGDTLTSMAEDVCNKRIAFKLRKYAKQILEANCVENKHEW